MFYANCDRSVVLANLFYVFVHSSAPLCARGTHINDEGFDVNLIELHLPDCRDTFPYTRPTNNLYSYWVFFFLFLICILDNIVVVWMASVCRYRCHNSHFTNVAWIYCTMSASTETIETEWITNRVVFLWRPRAEFIDSYCHRRRAYSFVYGLENTVEIVLVQIGGRLECDWKTWWR